VIDKGDARTRALDYLATRGVDAALLDDLTQEESFGWVFFYNSAKFIETGNPRDSLAGNAPIVVFRDSGNVQATGTSATA
jgi:Immunity protein 35